MKSASGPAFGRHDTLLFLCAFALCSACTDELVIEPGVPPLLGGDCDPLVPSFCGFPFPSNAFTIDDPNTVTKKRVLFGKTSLLMHAPEKYADPAPWSRNDGFSAGQTLLAHFPGATVEGLPSIDNLSLSTEAHSPTILMEADTQKRVPHFAELDMNHDDDAYRAFMIRPVIRLKDATRYIVAIRGVRNAQGSLLEPSDAFRALRDDEDSTEVSVERRRDLYDDIFSRLEEAGIARDDLQLAWDFTTASKENNTRALVFMRDDALSRVGEDGPEYVIKKIEENPNPHIRRRITGVMTVPLYLDHPEPGGSLVLDAEGLPTVTGTTGVEFLVHIPNSLADAGRSGPLLQNGHGLLGSMYEGQNGYLAEFANAKGYVAFSVNLAGMESKDAGYIAEVVEGDVGRFQTVVDRQHQGLVNSLLAMRLMKGRFARDPNVIFNGVSVIDPTRRFYRGDSQGGIFGATYMALTTEVSRGLLGEPGAPYSLLLERSIGFDSFLRLLRSVYVRPLDVAFGIGLAQMLWDRTEPNGYAAYITKDTLPGTSEHQILMHVAIGDHQVTPLGAHYLARTAGVKNLLPVNRSIFGIEEVSAPYSGSALVEFEFGLPPAPPINIPQTQGADPHDEVRILQTSIDQTDKFLKDGVIDAFCDGTCNPE